VLRGRSGAGEAVAWIVASALPLPAFALGRALWAAAALATFLIQRRRPGLRPALLAAATLVFSYAVLATGVFENHIHPLFLLMLAAGLETRRERVIAAAAAVVYVLDVLMLSGLGRFYTMRYLALARSRPTSMLPAWRWVRLHARARGGQPRPARGLVAGTRSSDGGRGPACLPGVAGRRLESRDGLAPQGPLPRPRPARPRRRHCPSRVFPIVGQAVRRARQRVFVLGFDGMDPTLARKWMDEGKLPNLKRWPSRAPRQAGDHAASESPVAWPASPPA